MFANSDGSVIALNAESGMPVWERETIGDSSFALNSGEENAAASGVRGRLVSTRPRNRWHPVAGELTERGKCHN